ncbi:BspA family leucine-rich repeat surface protein, partial [Rickettsiales bacterium]|nr:BspA family leucine-rich repeat surface protein [Rickettsiales bacterium]
TITYNSSYLGESNAANFTCNTGYQYDTNIPKYWFTLSGDTPAVHTSGDSCIEQTYILGQDGNHSLPDNAIDPGTFTGSDLIGYTAESPRSISCAPRHSGQGNLGVYLDNGVLKAQGSCVYSSSNSPDCYDVSITPIGSIGAASGCAGMLVVDREMLNSAKGDSSYDFKPGDSYTSHSGATYTFANGSNNIFTGQITDMSWFFHSSSFNQDISNWDVSSVTNMSGMFSWDCHSSPTNLMDNINISSWDVSSVTSMGGMFACSAFNSDISNLDVSNITNMDGMFRGSGFNQDISNWDVSNVTSMAYMFGRSYKKTSPFNQPIGNWDVSNVTNMSDMFNSSSFNQPIGNWDVGNVTNMGGMFGGGIHANYPDPTTTHFSYFNQDISGWDVSSVTSMGGMFYMNQSFSYDLPNWDVSNVTNMSSMFAGGWHGHGISLINPINIDLSNWCVQNVTNYHNFNIRSSLSGANMPPSFGSSTNCN